MLRRLDVLEIGGSILEPLATSTSDRVGHYHGSTRVAKLVDDRGVVTF